MTKFIVAAVLLAALVIGLSMAGCGPRAGVAADKIMDKIDKVLGELDVKQKDIQIKYAELEKATEAVRDQRIETQVRLERIEIEKTGYEAAKAKIENNLKELMPRIEEAKQSEDKTYVNDNDKAFTLEQLATLADSMMNEHSQIESQLTSRVKTLYDVLSRNMTLLTNQEKVATDNLKQLKLRLEEINQKKAAIDAIKEASEFAGPSTSINEKFDALNKDVEDLLTDMEVTYRKEEIEISDVMNQAGATSIEMDDVLEGSADGADDTLDRMKAILGG